MINNHTIHVLSRAVIIDQQYILLCKTLDLPISFYFLPGGHIEHGESAESAVIREVFEESGSQCVIKRFLGCLEYSFEPGHSSICHNHEYNFIFEAKSDSLKHNTLIPQREDHIQLMWVPLLSINEIDFRPEPLKRLIPIWLELNMHNAFGSAMI